MPGQPDKSETVPADTVVTRYFQYLNFKTFDTAYDTLTDGLKKRVTFDSYTQMQNQGLSYKVEKLTRNKKDDQSAEVIATVLITGEDGGAPRYVEYKFNMKKENQKWKIDSYDYSK